MNTIIRKIYLSLSIVMLCSSCEKYLEVDPPVDQLTRSTVFQDPGTINAAMTGLYSQAFFSTLLSFGSEFYPGMFADEFHFAFPFYDVFKDNAYNEQTIILPTLWSDGYSLIYEANDMIGSLASTNVITKDVQTQYIGEAKFFRAFAHFMLSNLYGDVPLILSTDVVSTALQPRVSRDTVMQQVIADLKDAQAALQSSGNPRTKVTAAAAEALLARAYLYSRKWSDAETSASHLIESGQFSLETDVSKVFLKGSPESILQISSTGGSQYRVDYTQIAAFYIPFGPSPNTLVDSTLLSAFEPGDLRKQNWINSFTGTSPYFPYKYKQNMTPANPDLGEDYVVFRLAEQYLVRAEARAQQENIHDAVDDLNIIRHRAGLDPISYSISEADVLLAVEQERRIELFAEWGHRWFDLARTGRADAVLGAKKPNWKHRAILLPIPFAELQNNPRLTQNEGY
jgi:hypothetical protein